jgi:hypothetical protein
MEYNNMEYNNMEYNMSIQYDEYPQYTNISPKILKIYDNEKIYNIHNIIYVLQTPPTNYAYVPNYISAGPQTHFALYKITDNNTLDLLYDALLIVYDGCSAYLIDKNIRVVMRQNKLSKLEIDLLFQNKYEFITPIE